MNKAEYEPAEDPAFWEEGPGESASFATILGSGATMRRLWDTPEEDESWKHLEDL